MSENKWEDDAQIGGHPDLHASDFTPSKPKGDHPAALHLWKRIRNLRKRLQHIEANEAKVTFARFGLALTVLA